MKFYILLLIFLVVFISNNFAQPVAWDYLNMPEVGEVEDIKIDSNGNIFLGTYNGLYRSQDKGRTWKHLIGNDLTRFQINKSENIVVAVYNTNYPLRVIEIYYSEDKGNYFNQIEMDSINNKLYIDKVILTDNNAIMLLIRNEKDSLLSYYSAYPYNHWEKNSFKLNLPKNIQVFHTSVENDNVIYIGGYKDNYNYDTGVLYYTDDYGKNWKLLDSSLSDIIRCWKFIDENRIYLGTGNGLYYTSNKGKTWIPKGFNNKNNSIYDFIIDSNGVFYSSVFMRNPYFDIGIYHSKDSCKTWTRMNLEILSIVNTLAISDNKLYAGDRLGFHISSDSGQTWQLSNKGFSGSNMKSIGFGKKGEIYTGGYGGLYKSTDNGKNWKSLISIQENPYKILVNDKNDIFYISQGVGRSTDKGETWQIFTDGLIIGTGNPDALYDLIFNKRGWLLGGSSFNAYYYSTDYGEKWNRVNDGWSTYSFAINSEGHLFRGSDMNEVARSTDDGDTWHEVIGLDHTIIACDQTSKITFIPGTTKGYTDCLFKTDDNGRYWYYQDHYSSDFIFIDAVDSLGYLWSFYNGLKRTSPDFKIKFEDMSAGLFHKDFNFIAVSPEGYIWLSAKNGGLYRSREPYVGVKEEAPPQINDVSLLIRPNPSSGEVTIDYEVERRGHIRLLVTDLLGRQVALLADEEKEAGRYEAKFSTQGLSGGVYMCRMTSSGSTKLIKIMVMK
ncbi:MAG: hypothetical protein QG635_255 [Bacteroidota bacterium]|nr:hypothetical protein [Bacteroidota bacterium]